MHMLRISLILSLITAFCVRPAPAQEPHDTRISVSHQGLGILMKDLKALLDLTPTAQEREEWINVEDYLSILADGVDSARPIRVDVLTGFTPVTYVIWIPYTETKTGDGPKALRDNLNGFDMKHRRSAPDLFEFQGQDIGWLRVLPGQKYVALVLTTKANHDLLRQIVLKLDAPEAKPDSSVVALVANDSESPEDQEKRRSAFAEARRVSLDALEKRPTESDTEFALRKGALDRQLDEIDRLVTEAKQILASLALTDDASTATLKFSARAIPDTSLADSIALFGTQPDAFDSITSLDGAVFSGRINHPIDDLRRENATSFIELIRADVDDRVNTSTVLSADEKKHSLAAFDGIAALTRDSIATGYLNGFIEAVPDGDGEFTSVGAVAVMDGLRLVEVLNNLEKARTGNSVEIGMDSVGDVQIHKVTLATGFIALIDRVIGTERSVLIGTSEKHVWLASGTGALELLKKKIAELKDPVDNGIVIKTKAHLGPWVRRVKKIADQTSEPTESDERQRWRERNRRLVQAVESLAMNDKVTFDVTVTEGLVDGTLTFDKGILTFVGRLISAFSRENLNGG